MSPREVLLVTGAVNVASVAASGTTSVTRRGVASVGVASAGAASRPAPSVTTKKLYHALRTAVEPPVESRL
jgi:hypothetical protein